MWRHVKTLFLDAATAGAAAGTAAGAAAGAAARAAAVCIIHHVHKMVFRGLPSGTINKCNTAIWILNCAVHGVLFSSNCGGRARSEGIWNSGFGLEAECSHSCALTCPWWGCPGAIDDVATGVRRRSANYQGLIRCSGRVALGVLFGAVCCILCCSAFCWERPSSETDRTSWLLGFIVFHLHSSILRYVIWLISWCFGKNSYLQQFGAILIVQLVLLKIVRGWFIHISIWNGSYLHDCCGVTTKNF